MDTLALVKKAQKGDDEAFEQLITMYQDRLYRTAHMYVQNKEDALDIVQETVYKAYLSIEQLKKPDYFLTWLTRSLMHHAHQIVSEKKKIMNIQKGLPLHVSNELKHAEPNVTLRDTIMQLDENYQTVILLSYYYDLPIEHIAWHLSVPESTIATYLQEATKLLSHVTEGGDLHGQKQTY
jgi:RNA polymerase sigma-70 factor, ECF subfamily